MTNPARPGPASLAPFLARHGRGPSPALDALCAQHDAHTTLLYWFTDLDAAIAEATRTGRPILSLVLLGRLDQERSCANSRFFRRSLYVDPAINRTLRDRFVLHWRSLRPVPQVTIDFGDGRRLVKTLTGNSAHLVLAPTGRPIDVLPGLFTAAVFARLLDEALALAATDHAGRADHHRRALRRPPPPPAPPPPALVASRLAPSKHRVEAPLLRAVALDVDHDTAIGLELHARVHARFAADPSAADPTGAPGPAAAIDALIEWVYRDLFAMPLDRPTLGLDVPEPFTSPSAPS